MHRGCKNYTHFKTGKLYYNYNTQFIPITKDEYNSRLTSANTRGAQSGYHQRLDTSDYGELLIEQRNFIIIFVYCNWFLPGDSGYFTCKQNMKLVTTRFKSGGLHEKHAVATWNVGNHLSICL